MEAAVVHLPAVSRSRQVGVTEATRTVEMNADTRKLRIGEVAAANAAGATTRETMMAVVVVASSDGMNATSYVGNSGEHTEAAGACCTCNWIRNVQKQHVTLGGSSPAPCELLRCDFLHWPHANDDR